MENKNINPIGPVINNDGRQLNNIDETTPATVAENQRHVEQAVDGRQLQANSEQQMPEVEVRDRNGEVATVDQPNQGIEEGVQNLVRDLCQMTPLNAARALYQKTAEDVVVTLNYMSKMNSRRAIEILTIMMDEDKANLAANVISEMDIELSIKLLSDMETGVASMLLANMDQQTAVNFLQLMQTTTKTQIEIFYYMTPKEAAGILKHMDVRSAIDIITTMFKLEIVKSNVGIYVKKGFAFDILKIEYSLFNGMEPKIAAEILIHMEPKIAADIVCCGAESFVDILCEMSPNSAANILYIIGYERLIKSVNILSAVSKKDASKAADIVTAMAITNTEATNNIFLNMGSMHVANIISEMDPEVAAKVILARVLNAIAEILGLMTPEKAAAILVKMDKSISDEILSKMRKEKAEPIRQEMKKAQSK